MLRLTITAIAVAALGACAQPGGSTNLSSLLTVCDQQGSCPTGSTATVAGEILAEGDIETDANLDVAGTSTLTGAVTASSTLAVTGATTLTGEINGAIRQTDEVAISLSEMINLRGTNKTLVAAKGANTVIQVESVLFFIDYGSAVFTESSDDLAINYVDAAGAVACPAFETTASFLVAAADAYGNYHCASNLTASVAQAVNKAVSLDNNGDGEFGDGTGSTVTVWITYLVIDVS